MRAATVLTMSFAALALMGAGRTVAPASIGDPDPADREAVVAVCGGCHPVNLVDDQVRSYEDWQQMVRQMAERGAKGTDAQFERIDNYLYLTLTAINVNVVAPEDLAAILQISPAAAEAIAVRRARKPFKSLDDLAQVAGVPDAHMQARGKKIGF